VTQAIEVREVVEGIGEAEAIEVVEVAQGAETVQVVEAMEVVEEGEASPTAQMQELEKARVVEERKQHYQEKLRQIKQRIRQEATHL